MEGAGHINDYGVNRPDWADISSTTTAPYPEVADVFIYDKFRRGRLLETMIDSNMITKPKSWRESYRYLELVDLSDETLPANFTPANPPYCMQTPQCTPRPQMPWPKLQILTAGYGTRFMLPTILDAGDNFGIYCQRSSFYPWEVCTQAANRNPSCGPEMAFGADLRDLLLYNSTSSDNDDIVVIVKFAVGGTSVINRDQDMAYDAMNNLVSNPTVSWSVSGNEMGPYGANYLETYKRIYIAGSIGEARAMASTSGFEVTIGGIISLIGSNDALRPPYVGSPLHLANKNEVEALHLIEYTAAIDDLRDYIRSLDLTPPSSQNWSADSIPYLVLMSPRANILQGDLALRADYLDRIALVRMAQQELGLLPNVDVIDSTAFLNIGPTTSPDGLHAGIMETSELGHIMARWAATRAPLPFQ
jgi:hypothetical protein